MKKETFDNIPEWAIYFLAYGESDELTEEEVDEVTTFTTINFPVGYTMDVKWDTMVSKLAGPLRPMTSNLIHPAPGPGYNAFTLVADRAGTASAEAPAPSIRFRGDRPVFGVHGRQSSRCTTSMSTFDCNMHRLLHPVTTIISHGRVRLCRNA